MKNLVTLSVLLLGITLSSCGGHAESTDQKQSDATELMVAEANRQVGMPNITNFTERKFAKMIRELCDTEVATFTYIVDMNGKRHFLCESIGYGIPYSVQFTNPEKALWQSGHQSMAAISIPQAEANGLFMPSSSSATWVLAATPTGVSPIYVESEILVSPFELEE